jgi:hypothetical protein
VKSFAERDLWQKSGRVCPARIGGQTSFEKKNALDWFPSFAERRVRSPLILRRVSGDGRRKIFCGISEIASDSLEETKYFLRLSKDLQYLSEEQHLQLKLDCAEAGRLLAV